MAFQLTRLNVPSLTTDYSAETNAAGSLAQTLGNLIPNIQKRQTEAQKQQILGQIGTGDMDFDKAGRALITLGDTQAGATLLTLGQKAKEQQREADWLKGNSGLFGGTATGGGSASVVPGTGSLIQNESGGNFRAQNSAVGAGGAVGHFGRAQFGQARLQEAASAGAIPPGTTPQQFMASPELQQRAEQWHFSDIDQAIKQNGYDQLVGKAAIGGVPVTVDGLRAVAHLGGKEGMRRFVETQGRYNPADANGTRLSDYFARHGGGGGGAPAQVAQAPVQMAQATPQPGASVPDVPAAGAAPTQFVIPGAGQTVSAEIASDPQVRNLTRALDGAPERFKAGIQKRLEQRIEDLKFQRGEDGRQADVELKRLQAEAERRKLAGQTPVAGYRYKPDGGLEAIPGGPADEKRPANEVESRRAAAERAGLKPGDPRYENYLLTATLGRADEGKISEGDKKAVQEADDSVMASRTAITALNEAKALSKQAMSGPTAGARAMLGNNLPDMLVPDFLASPKASEATTNLENTVTAQALAQMKAIFGAAPTEGERKILLDIQGSINQPDNVRQKIYDRAIKAAEARLEFNQKRAEQIRGGDYYKAPGARQGSGQPQPAPQPQSQRQPAQGVPQGARQAPDGNFYVPDPSRPGKYLMVQP